MVAASKVPMLKPGEFEIWGMRIKQYIQMMDYALWEVIENGATLPRTQVVDGVTTVLPITTTKKKAQRRLEVKARSTLMMSIPNEHQLKFNSIKDAKKLLKRDLLVTRWNTHVVVWMNKADMNTMSMDDLYNNLKVYKPEVKGMSSSNSNTQNMAFLSSTNSSTNAAVNNANRVSTTSTQVNSAFSTNIDNLSDAVICVFLASQPNSPQLVHEDLKQIHPDNIKRDGLKMANNHVDYEGQKWSATTATKGDTLLGSGRALRNQDFKHKESTRRTVPVETPTFTMLVSCDGLGRYDWSDQA
nr:hypothetical protein [Tanacetum cinerariifolium]